MSERKDKVLGYPKGFKEYQQLLTAGHNSWDMGFRVRQGDINRFAHRLRAARVYQGGDMSGYGERTRAGYEGLQRVLLTHSALELFRPTLFGKRERSLNAFLPLLEGYPQEEVMRVLHTYDPERAFWSAFRDRCHKSMKGYLDKCDSGEQVNVLQVSAAIRHDFAHGHLTPGANGVDPRDVRVMCDAIAGFVMNFMDEEFCRRVKGYCEERGLELFGV